MCLPLYPEGYVSEQYCQVAAVQEIANKPRGFALVLVRFIRVFLIASVITLSCGAAVLVDTPASGGATTTPDATSLASASTGPHCTFNGSSLPLVTGVSAGSKIAVSCKGLPPLHPYLFVATSLVLAIDPAAAPLLSGQVTS